MRFDNLTPHLCLLLAFCLFSAHDLPPRALLAGGAQAGPLGAVRA